MQVHKRVRLAIRLDEVQRVQTKEKAEQSWRQRAADEVLLSNCLHWHFSVFANSLYLQFPLFAVPFIRNCLHWQFPPFCNALCLHCMAQQFPNCCCLSKHKTMHQSHILPRQTCHRPRPFCHAKARKTLSYQQLLCPKHASVTDNNNSARWLHRAEV